MINKCGFSPLIVDRVGGLDGDFLDIHHRPVDSRVCHLRRLWAFDGEFRGRHKRLDRVHDLVYMVVLSRGDGNQ